MSDFVLLGVFIVFLSVGLKYPVIAFCGYMWTDLITPHQITFGFLKGQQLSLYMALIAIISFFLHINKIKLPNAKVPFCTLCLFLLWIIASNSWAVFPIAAGAKFDVVWKALLMSILMSLIVNSKKDFEMVDWCIIGCLTFYMVSAGLKTITGGGGYGARLVPSASNSGFSESSTLATIAVITLVFYTGLYNVKGCIMHFKSRWLLVIGIILSLATVIGSTARTGLVALVAFAFLRLKHMKNFTRNTISISILAFVIASAVPQEFYDRMEGISSPSTMLSESSRFITWQWVLDDTRNHPFGTGFRGFVLNRGKLAEYAPIYMYDEYKNKMYAYHNVFIEVLHTQGYPGIVLYLFLIFTVLKSLSFTQRNSEDPWVICMSRTVINTCIIYLVGGMFIGVAFNPLFFYLLVLALSLGKIAADEE